MKLFLNMLNSQKPDLKSHYLSHMDSIMPFKKFRLKMCWLFLSFLLLSITACNPFSPTTSLEKIQENDEIIMGTINSSLTYSYDGLQYSGFDYELGKKFAEYLNVELRIEEFDTLKALLAALDNDDIDFIGSGLTLTPKRGEKYRSSPPYYYVSQKVVYHKGTYRPRKITDVKEPIGVLADSSHEETLDSLLTELPDLKRKVLENEDQESLLRKVADKEIKFALVDSTTLAQKQRYYPVLAEAFTISKKQPVAWLIKRTRDDALYSAMIEFIGSQHQEQTIAKLEEKYFGHVENFDFVDTKIFLKRIKTILPKYEELFKKYTTAEVDWSLLAAVSYQESHWNPKAKSPTGVRGMMMLTLATAKYIGIKNRLNAKQSIEGGAKYLSQLINRLPNSIADDEKVWFALASYNIGYGHLMDARRITAMKRQNPDSWSDVKENLPLLHQKQWYKKTRYGYARGKEAQHYVNNIRQYRKSLTWFIAEREKEAKEKALAEQKAIQKAQALAAQQALQKPLTKEEALQKALREIQAKEKALQQAQQKTQEMDSALQKAKDKTIVAENALQEIQQKILAEEEILQQAKATSLAQQQALRAAQDQAFKEETLLLKNKEKTLAEQQRLQQVKDKALAELEASLQAKNEAITEQQTYQQAIEKALSEQESLLKSQEEEQQELEEPAEKTTL